LIFGPDGNLYVSSLFTGSVLRFDGVTGASLGTFATSPDRYHGVTNLRSGRQPVCRQ
jgi:hypothetical protein